MARAYTSGSIQLSTLTLGQTYDIALPAAFQTVFGINGKLANVMSFRMNGRSELVDTAAVGDVDICEGIAVSVSSRRCMVGTETNRAADPSFADQAVRDDCVIALHSHAATGASNGKVDINAVDENKVQLIISEALPYAIVIQYEIAITVEAAIADIAEPAATGDFTSGNVSFEPDYCEVFFSGASSFNTPTAGLQLSHGFANASESAVYGVKAQDATNTANTSRIALTGSVVEVLSLTADTSVFRATFVGFNWDGANGSVTLNSPLRNLNRQGFVLLTKGMPSKIDGFDTTTTNGGTVTRSGYTFQPRLVSAWAVGAGGPDTGGAGRTGLQFSVGVVDDVNNTPHGLAYGSNDGAATQATATAIRYDAMTIRVSGTASVAARATLSSWNSDGFVWTQTLASAVAEYVIARSFSPPDYTAGGGGGGAALLQMIHHHGG